LDGWGKDGLSGAEATKLVDMLFVTGQQLYECQKLPEWKKFVDEYQRHWFSDEDKRFRHSYAVLEDCPNTWIDKNSYYKAPLPPAEWVTRTTEIVLGLRAVEGEKAKSIRRVSSELQTVLSRIELNARIFLAARAILEVAVDAIGLDVTDKRWLLFNLDERLGLYAEQYNHRLSKVKEEPKPWSAGESKLQKALKILPVIDLDKLVPADKSMQRLKNSILDGLRDDGWLQGKICSLEYDDGFLFSKMLDKS